VYTGQSPPLTKEEIEPLLKEARIARFCSHNKDGTIHAVPMNYKYENNQIIIPTPAASHKVRNVKRNPNVTVLIDAEKQPVKGVIIYGKAELEYNDILTSSISVYEKTMPRDQAERLARGLLKLTKMVTIRVDIERIVSFDAAKDKAFQTALQG